MLLFCDDQFILRFPMIRIVLAEDQAMVRGALVALLKLEPDFEIVAEAADGQEAWDLVQRHHPDLLVSDIEMPKMTGLELAQRIHASQSENSKTRVVIVTTFARAGYLRRALDAGVRGYLLKDAPSAQLADALRQVHAGQRVIDPQLAIATWTEQDPLSNRERQVLRLAGEGSSSAEIAEQLSLTQGTVRNYLSEIISKLGASNRIEAYRLARQQGWL
jgi:two-component system, NarL family, response regulator DesR